MQYCDPKKLQWGWMCSDGDYWTYEVRKVICRELGYEATKIISKCVILAPIERGKLGSYSTAGYQYTCLIIS